MPDAEKDAALPLASARHNHALGEACGRCLHNQMRGESYAFTQGEQSGAQVLATARRVSDMYFLRTKELAAVLLDARGLVRGLDPTLDERIDAALKAAGFPPTCILPPAEKGQADA